MPMKRPCNRTICNKCIKKALKARNRKKPNIKNQCNGITFAGNRCTAEVSFAGYCARHYMMKVRGKQR